MSAKPVAAAPWATTANYPADAAPEAGTATKIAYPGGQATIGYRPNENPDAREDNDWRNKVGAFTQYLLDGDLDGPINIDASIGDFTVNGGSTVFATDFEVIGNFELDGDMTIDLGHTITVDGRNNRGLLMGAASTSYLSKDVPLDDRSIDNSFQTPGTLSIAQTAAHETTRIFSTNGAKFLAKCIHNEPGDQIEFITLVWDGPIVGLTPPDVRLLHFAGSQLGAFSDSCTTDATAPNNHRIGAGTTGSGRTFQRYTVVNPEPIPCGIVITASTVWQSAGTAHIEVTSTQVNQQIFRIFVEYRRKQPINYGV